MKSSTTLNGVKAFSATVVAQHTELGDVTSWINRYPELTISDLVVSQSSDASFHCIAIFDWSPTTRA